MAIILTPLLSARATCYTIRSGGSVFSSLSPCLIFGVVISVGEAPCNKPLRLLRQSQPLTCHRHIVENNKINKKVSSSCLLGSSRLCSKKEKTANRLVLQFVAYEPPIDRYHGRLVTRFHILFFRARS